MQIKDPILIVDDEVEMRIAMSASLKRCKYPVELSHNAIDALNKFKKNQYSLVITDMTMPKRSGVELLKDIKAINPNIPVILVTAYGTINTAIEAMKHGAFDYIQKPFDFDTFIFVVERAFAFQEKDQPLTAKKVENNKSIISENNDFDSAFKEIITQDKKTLELLEQAKKIASSKVTVLIQSESGTGKELLARFIHNHSDRKDQPFVAVNCAALPDSLLESELFGHKKGAFTGAINDHRGKFEQANGGTILLDEISEMALPLQAKLLRVLQEHTIDRVGGTESIPIDVRVIATTNRILLNYVEEEKFREDLYFRLNVIPLNFLPLRERKGDINLLADYFVKKYAQQNQQLSTPQISKEVYSILNSYHWRGNIRELENIIERSVLLSDGKTILPANLLMTPSKKETPLSQKNHEMFTIQIGTSLKEVEQQFIAATLEKMDGNQSKAAKTLGITLTELKQKISQPL